MPYTYEILLGNPSLSNSDWRAFLQQIAKYLGHFSHWQIILQYQHQTIRYYLQTRQNLPPSLNRDQFLLRQTEPIMLPASQAAWPTHHFAYDNFALLLHKLERHGLSLRYLVCDFTNYVQQFNCKTQIYYCQNDRIIGARIPFCAPENLFSIDFSKLQFLQYHKIPPYLASGKISKLLQANSEHALLQVDLFPYDTKTRFLTLASFDFAEHSLVLGSSGAGKSHFLAHFIAQIFEQHSEQFQVVVVDPHADFYRKCGAIRSQAVVDFQTLASSVDLFQGFSGNLAVDVELLVDLFRTLLGADFNNRLARVLRYGCLLLLSQQSFSFVNLRRLLVDNIYRKELLQSVAIQDLPNVASFFLTDFNNLKTQHYTTAIAPIIVLLDELQFAPVFNANASLPTFAETMQQHFLTIISLNRAKLSTKITETITGLVLQQLFLYVQTTSLSKKLVLVIDEVATIKTPILARFLSELRKFNVAVFLAGQYLEQLDPQLLASIFANTKNYYLFQTSRHDSEIIAQNLSFKTAHTTNRNDILTKLNPRECLVKITTGNRHQPLFKAKTSDFLPQHLSTQSSNIQPTQISFVNLMQNQITGAGTVCLQQPSALTACAFDTESAPSMEEVLHTQSTNRRKINLQIKERP